MFHAIQPGSVRRVLQWTLATPFFWMPLPLTLLAWDLYGGFGIHRTIFVVLLAIGLGLGLIGEWARERADRRANQVSQRKPEDPDLKDEEPRADSGRLINKVVLLLILGQGLLWGAELLTIGTARVLLLIQPGADGLQLLGLPLRGVFGLLILVSGHQKDSAGDGSRFGSLVGLAWLLTYGCLAGTLILGWPTQTAAVGVLVLLGFTLWIELPKSIAWLVSRAAVAVAILAVSWLLLSRIPQVLFGVDPRKDALRLAAPILAAGLTAAAMTLLPKRAVLLRALGHLSMKGVLAGLTLGLVGLPFATIGGLIGELSSLSLPLPTGTTGVIRIADPGHVGHLALIVGLFRIGLDVRQDLDLSPTLRWLSAAFTLTAIAGIGCVHSFGLVKAAEAAILGVGLLPWLPELWNRIWVQRTLTALSFLAPLPILIVAGRYFGAAFPLLANPELIAVFSVVLSLPVAIAFARLRVQAKLKPLALVVRALLCVLSFGLLIYIGVFLSIAPAPFLGTVLALGLLIGISHSERWTRGGLPRLHLGVSLWLLFYVSFAGTVVFKEGPDNALCEAVMESTDARVLLDRFGEGGEYLSGDPYDIQPDPTGRWLVATFKRFDSRGGWIEVIDTTDPARRTRTKTKPTVEGSPFWPERFVVDPQTGHFYFGMLGINAYELWDMELTSSGEETPTIELVRSSPLDWEPSYPDIDTERNLLVQSYLSAGVERSRLRQVEQPLVQTIGLDSLSPVRAWSMGPATEEMSEYVKVHPSNGNYYIPGYFNLVRFALVEVDGDTLELKRRVEMFHPTIAIGFDDSGERMFVTNSLGGTLDEYDLQTLTRTSTVASGSFPRDLVVDSSGERVFVGNYSSGTVVEFDISGGDLVRVKEVSVGPLLRGLGIHKPSGAVYAASGCGIFEIAAGRS